MLLIFGHLDEYYIKCVLEILHLLPALLRTLLFRLLKILLKSYKEFHPNYQILFFVDYKKIQSKDDLGIKLFLIKF